MQVPMQLLILPWLTLRRSNGFLTDDSNHDYSNLLYTSPNHKMDGENFSRKLLMLWVLSSPPFPLCHHLALRAPSYAYNQYLPQHQKCKVKTRLSYSCGMMGGGGVKFLCCLVHLYWTLLGGILFPWTVQMENIGGWCIWITSQIKPTSWTTEGTFQDFL